ncbi:MAG: hypothetical protein AAGJ91_07915 [Pseudomonadota bacterium]
MGPLNVTDDERGAVRVFAIDARGKAWTDAKGRGWKLPDALGLETLVADDVQVFDKGDLMGMSLAQFLSEGYDVSEAELTAQGRALADAEGTIAVIRSAAITDKPVVLTPSAEIRFVGLFHEPSAPPITRPSVGMLGDFESAKRRPEKPKSPPRDSPAPEDDGARLVETIRPSREAYIRAHLWLGAAAMGGATAVLYWLGNPDFWVGAIAGLGAIAVRGLYLASEELGLSWELTETSLRGRSGEGAVTRVVTLGNVAAVRRLGSAVQVVTKSGDKLLMKYMGDPASVQARLARAAKVPHG